MWGGRVWWGGGGGWGGVWGVAPPPRGKRPRGPFYPRGGAGSGGPPFLSLPPPPPPPLPPSSSTLYSSSLPSLSQLEAMDELETLLADATEAFLNRDFDTALSKVVAAQALDLKSNRFIYLLYKASILLGAKKYAEAAKEAIAFATNAPRGFLQHTAEKFGTLRKKGEVNTAFRSRHFLLSHNHFLYYFKNPKDSKPAGVALLYRMKIEAGDKNIIIVRAPRRLFTLKADSPIEQEQWLNVLQKHSQEGLRIPRYPNIEAASPATLRNALAALEAAPPKTLGGSDPEGGLMASASPAESSAVSKKNSDFTTPQPTPTVLATEDTGAQVQLSVNHLDAPESRSTKARISVNENRSPADRYFSDLGLPRPNRPATAAQTKRVVETRADSATPYTGNSSAPTGATRSPPGTRVHTGSLEFPRAEQPLSTSIQQSNAQALQDKEGREARFAGYFEEKDLDDNILLALDSVPEDDDRTRTLAEEFEYDDDLEGGCTDDCIII
eukprot:TRINITY_DN297_c0_g1_i2.p1 TRINITY_DN297_c0_g1~~TRINITY_DN297_c0_g1_i2.p1  ORF type:complete len:497 (-),score=81.68 TRINITY_DN297_c0_g1_i2:193-1683(-)